MNWLARLDDKQRSLFGSISMTLGIGAVTVGVLWAHYANFSVESDVDTFLSLVPRGWWSVTIGQIVAVGGSQMIVLGALMLFVIHKKMTWARAGLTTFIAWFELLLVYGIIPSEWLNLTQGPLGWTSQKDIPFISPLPKWLVLNNEVSLSLAVLKDAISGAYHMVVLAGGIWFAYKVQDFGKGQPAAEAPATSPYGRPLVKGSR
ncbi:MAG: hypothetical protein OEP52_08540 [Acidimicrobiia bacterium]|nr:hypothetical protein [Acidimicrobiia bacterium]